MKQLLRMKKTEIVLFLTPFIARWPLLSIGFGVEEDAWGHVLNGMEMAESGGYIISRLPSHPLMEALSFVLWKTIGPMAFYWNLFSLWPPHGRSLNFTDWPAVFRSNIPFFSPWPLVSFRLFS